jgi:hypothetical protein
MKTITLPIYDKDSSVYDDMLNGLKEYVGIHTISPSAGMPPRKAGPWHSRRKILLCLERDMTASQPNILDLH